MVTKTKDVVIGGEQKSVKNNQAKLAVDDEEITAP